MNWISLLYPRPHFEVHNTSVWMQRLHVFGLQALYYASHSLALLCLLVVYLILIIPLKIISVLKRDDLLETKKGQRSQSYLKKSESVETLQFERMY